MFCTNCGKENKANAKYCKACGTYLIEEEDKHCPQCHMIVDENDIFCDSCGYRLIEDSLKETKADKHEDNRKVAPVDNDYEDVEKFPVFSQEELDSIPIVTISSHPEEEAFKPIEHKTIEDYEFPSEEEEIPSVQDNVEEFIPVEPEPIEEEPVMEKPEGKKKKLDINSFFKKKEESIKPQKEEPKVEEKENMLWKKINVLLIVFCILIFGCMFLPFYVNSWGKEYGYLSSNVLTQFGMGYKILTTGKGITHPTLYVSKTMEIISIVGMIGILSIVIGIIARTVAFAIKNLDEHVYSNDYGKYFRLCLILMVCYMMFFDAYGIAPVSIVVILVIVLLFKYFFEIKNKEKANNKRDNLRFIAYLVTICILAVSLTFVGSWNMLKTALLKDFYDKADIIVESVSSKLAYRGDLIKFLGSMAYVSILFACLMGIYITIKLLHHKLETKYPFKSAVFLNFLVFSTTVYWMIAYSLTEKWINIKPSFGETLGFVNSFAYLLWVFSGLLSIYFFLRNRKIKNEEKESDEA